MSGNVKFDGVTPCLMYADANAALEWLERVLGFQERARYVDKDAVVGQAHLLVGEDEVWVAGRAGHQPDARPQYLVVWVDDVDAQYERVKAVGVEVSPPVNQSWGVRNFHVRDPGGYYWSFARKLAAGYRQVKTTEEGALREIVKHTTPASRVERKPLP